MAAQRGRDTVNDGYVLATLQLRVAWHDNRTAHNIRGLPCYVTQL